MESYVPLVKAIIISTMFSSGTSSVVITEQYMLKESIVENQKDSKKDTSYQIYDLKKQFAYHIDSELKFKSMPSLDSIDGSNIGISSVSNLYYLINISSVKEDFGDFKCKKEIKEVTEVHKDQKAPGDPTYSDESYFAKIPWLDAVLNTEEKKTFAGFERQEYSPYYYLIYESIHYPNQEPKDQVLRIIEKTEVDTTFIHTLLNLPLKDN